MRFPDFRLLLPFIAVLAGFCGCSQVEEQVESLVDEATVLHADGQPKQALDRVSKALKIAPDDVAGLTLRGQLLQELGDLKEAANQLQRAVDLAPNVVNPLSVLAGVRIQQLAEANPSPSIYGATVSVLRELINQQPNNQRARFDLAKILSAGGETAAGIRLLDDLVAENPLFAEAVLLRSSIQKDAEPRRCLADLTRLLEDQPRNVDALMLRGEIQSRLELNEQAIVDFKKASGVDQTNPDASHFLGRELLRAGDYAGAVNFLHRARELKPSDANIVYHLYLATAALQDDRAAAGYLAACLGLPNAPAEAYIVSAENELVDARRDSGQYSRALSLLKKVSREQRESLSEADLRRLQLMEARCQSQLQRTAEAIILARQVYESDHTAVEPAMLYAELLLSQNETEQIPRILGRLELNPTSQSDLMIRRATLLRKTQLPLLALDDLNRLLQRKPNDVEALYLRASIRVETGSPGFALSDLIEAIRHAPDFVEARTLRSAVLAELGEISAAADDLVTVAAQDPHDEQHLNDVIGIWRRTVPEEDIPILLSRMNEHPSIRLTSDLADELLAGLEQRGGDPQIFQQYAYFSAEIRSSPAVVIRTAIAEAKAGRHKRCVELLQSLPRESQTQQSYWLLAESLIQVSQLADARTIVAELIEASPDSESLRLTRLKLLLAERNWMMLNADAEAVLKQRPDHPMARLALGMYLFANSRYEEALQYLDTDAVRKFDTIDSLWARSRSLAKLRRIAQAESELAVLLKTDPQHASARLLRATLAEERQDYRQAMNDYAELLKVNSGNAWALIGRGRLLMKFGRYSDAETDFSTAVALSDEASARAYYFRGTSRMKREDYASAGLDFEECMKRSAESADPVLARAGTFARAAAFCGEREYQQALNLYDSFLKDHPKSADGWFHRGNLLYRAGYQKAAAASWASAVRSDRQMERAWLNLAAVMQELDEDKKAETAYRQLLIVNPESTVALDRLARLKIYSQDPECRDAVEAISLARRATELDQKQDWQLMDTLARAFHAAVERQDALYWAKMSRDAAPPNLQYRPRGVIRQVQEELAELKRRQRQRSGVVAVGHKTVTR